MRTGILANVCTQSLCRSTSRLCKRYCRQKMAELLSGEEEGVYFTSGGTEANFLAIHSILNGLPAGKQRFLMTEMEHQSIHILKRHLEILGFEVDLMKPNASGIITTEILERHLRPDTGLVSIQHANSETGVIQPLAKLSAYLHKRDVLLHVQEHVPLMQVSRKLCQGLDDACF